MNLKLVRFGWVLPVLLAGGIALFTPLSVWAHCDTLDGPVVKDAKAALEKGDVTATLKWVRKEDEGQIREAFQKTLAVRAKGPEARELADMYFFETLVRIHRAGEGAPFTGLKPAGAVEPVVAEADRALDSGSADSLAKAVSKAVTDGIDARFALASEKRKHADHNVEAGREYVEAYVQFVHYVERLHADAVGPAGHHGAAEEPAPAHEHH
ncbi:MAG: DUF6448 family protein [Acidobacteriota bacterium]